MASTYLTVIRKWKPSENLYRIHLQEEKPPFNPSSSSVDILSLSKLKNNFE
jgi:hypothetical protein